MSAATFDAQAYKETTRQQWEDAADAWHRWGPALESWLGHATETMLDLAGVDRGHRVLDVAAGAGGQTLSAARRVGPDGAVLATDISPRILEFAAAEARRAGLANVGTHAVDGEDLDVEPGSFDAAISRVGLIYFPDRQGALARIRRALRPGGRLGRSSTRRRTGTASSPSPSASSGGARSCRRPRPASRARSASAATACSGPSWRRPASRTSTSTRSRRRC